MIFAWWRRRAESARRDREDADRDARSLISLYGNAGYWEARKREWDARSGLGLWRREDHWRRVALEVARRTGHQIGVDTATRYLESDQ